MKDYGLSFMSGYLVWRFSGAAFLIMLLLFTVTPAYAQAERARSLAWVPGAIGISTVEETSGAQEATSESHWYDRLRFSGDFRTRYEGFYQADRQTRNLIRMRLRLRVDTQINDDTRFQLRVASGDTGTPVSTNQTYENFFLPKPFSLDQAYLAYNPAEASAMTLGMGKFGFPQTRTQLIFDDDLNLEGAWQQFKWRPMDGVNVNFVAIQAAVNEVSKGTDSYMVSGYGEVTFDLGSHALHLSAANYSWIHADKIALAQDSGPLRSILTNDVIRNNRGVIVGFASEFNVLDVIAEVSLKTGRIGYPLRFLVNFAHNTRSNSDRDSAFWMEAEYGNPRAVRTWGATYTYGWIQQDVTPSGFVFSDMPGTNLLLHMVETSYVLKPGLSLDLTFHLTKRLFFPNETPNNWLTRLHVAAVARF